MQAISGSLYPEGWRLVEAHRRAGHTVVLASSATRFQVEPAARAMGVEHILVSPVEIVNGICTGRPGGPLLWRAGRATAVLAFAEEHGIDLPQSYAYSNGNEDVPFLRTVGRPRAVNPGRHLADRLSDLFETRVKVELGRNKGKIVVEFASIDDLERIVKAMSPDGAANTGRDDGQPNAAEA